MRRIGKLLFIMIIVGFFVCFVVLCFVIKLASICSRLNPTGSKKKTWCVCFLCGCLCVNMHVFWSVVLSTLYLVRFALRHKHRGKTGMWRSGRDEQMSR